MSNETEIVNARRKMPPEFYMHLFFLVVATIVIVMSVVMRVVGADLVYLPGIDYPLPESCSSKIVFGFECPACGMTRAFISISSGQFRNAWTFNPASFLVYLFVVVQIPWQSYQLWRLRYGKAGIESKWIYLLPVAMTVCMLCQWIVRLAR